MTMLTHCEEKKKDHQNIKIGLYSKEFLSHLYTIKFSRSYYNLKGVTGV